MDNQLKKIIKLAKKTGDRIIVFDPDNNNSAYIVMTIDEYEKLAIGKSDVRSLTENELLDKINRDIAIWKSDQEVEAINDNFDTFNNNDLIDFEDVSEEKEYTNELETIENLENGEIDKDIDDKFFTRVGSILDSPNFNKRRPDTVNKKSKNFWKIPVERKKAAEEIIEEDRQYLEKIDY